MQKALRIAYVTILESFRRKDPYVVLILGFLVVLGAGLFSHFGIQGLEKFVKDVAFTVINVFCTIICVVAAGRQLPVEIENRTLYPLLAKPVSRSTVFLGKYLGVGAMASGVVILFSVELLVLFKFLGISIEPVFFQALYLRVLSMWFIAALVLFFSLVMTHAANVTVSILVVMAMNTFANTILTVHSELEGASRYAAETIYWVAPHLELFDLSKKVVHEWPAVPMWVLAAMTGYAVLYSGVFLLLGCLRFRRILL
jgi:ABC-type transport system involved in multi-copper enzyme maturation permease subunit